MPSYLQLPPVAQGVIAISAVALAIVRLLTASRPFWASFPAWLQKLVPAGLMAIAAIPTAIEHARSWLDVAVAVVVSGAMFWTASRGDKRQPLDTDGGPRIERVNSDPKLSPEDTLKLGPLGLLLFLGLAAHQQGCATAAPPCNEDKMRAIDAAYLADLGKACLSYPDAASCPDYLPLKAKHERDLESCPQ